MGSSRRAFLAVPPLVLALVVAVGVAAANTFTSGPLVQVSGASPFAACTADAVATQSGTVFVGSEVEPWVDVNPTNSMNLVGIWQQDRWSNGGARGLVAGASTNGGTSWTSVPIPGVTLCAGGAYQRATDPWVSFGQNGRVHQLALAFNDSNFDHGLFASFSANGGLTWSTPRVVIRDLAPTVFNDKQSITADPGNANVYAVWDRLVFPSERASIDAAIHTAAFRGPTWFNRSTNAGDSWEQPRSIYDPGQNDQTIGNQIVVLPNGTLVDIFSEFDNENAKKLRGGTVRVIRSSDKGTTWSQPFLIDRELPLGVFDPETGEDVRTGAIIPDIAVAPSGALYAVWEDARFSGFVHEAVAFSQSLDGGLNWSTPIQVNLTPTTASPRNRQAFTPSVDVSSDGTVAVTYYDFRNNTPDPATLPTDYFVIHCHGNCTAPASWTNEVRLTNASFDMKRAPNAGGFFTGDYEGLASVGTTFLPFWSQSDAGDRASIFFRRVGP
jgi:hypothetical protein